MLKTLNINSNTETFILIVACYQFKTDSQNNIYEHNTVTWSLQIVPSKNKIINQEMPGWNEDRDKRIEIYNKCMTTSLKGVGMGGGKCVKAYK